MKFVMVKAEVAAALAVTEAEFDAARPQLEGQGFPRPIAGLGERWSIMDVINWVNRDQSKAVADAGLGFAESANLRH